MKEKQLEKAKMRKCDKLQDHEIDFSPQAHLHPYIRSIVQKPSLIHMAIPSHRLSYVKQFKLCCVFCPSCLVHHVSEAVHTPLKSFCILTVCTILNLPTLYIHCFYIHLLKYTPFILKHYCT